MSTGPEISDHSPMCVERRPISTICGFEPHSALPTRTRSARTEIDGSTLSSNAPSIAKGRPDLLRDEGLDAALVSTQIGESEVEHDREEHSSHDGKNDDDETAK